ncbi:MAG TPA: type IV secretion system DNA-binding domain-containing protein [Smithella sp.]|nr:type IV secretion system DNA-binding domain-containing protein [Smithella sp.]
MIWQGIERALISLLESGSALAQLSRENPRVFGLLLGMGNHLYDPRKKEKIFLSNQDRIKHLYVLGATGSGKTKLIEYFIRQDIQAGRGFCLLDPHGDLSNSILQYLAALAVEQDSLPFLENLSNKLIIIEPFNQEGAVGFNPLETRRYSAFAQASELMGIFKKVWQDAHWGPRMEELLRNSFVTLSENGLTLLETPRLLTDPAFRERMIQGLKDEAARDYWLTRYHVLSDKMQAVYREPVLNRMSVFIGDPSMRIMLGQARSTIDFRQIMDSGKWLIINLSKGQLRENAYLLGSLLIGKLKLAAMTRAELPEKQRTPFYLFIDEFQNFISEDFETILSEARKYGLGLTLAHQNLDQIDHKLQASILGNVGAQVVFRLSHHDAALIAQEMDPKARPIIEKGLIDFKVGQAYAKLRGEKPRLLRTMHVSAINQNKAVVEIIREISFVNYTRSRREVEVEIEKRRTAFSPRVGSLDATFQRRQTIRPGVAPLNEESEGWNGW